MARPRGVVTPRGAESYKKPVVVLLDPSQMSHTEFWCMALKNAQRVTFVGTRTSGANGQTSFVYLIGGVAVRFSGSRALFMDGSDIQGRGITPDIEIEPTIEGVVEGRDEVFEKGLEVLRQLAAK